MLIHALQPLLLGGIGIRLELELFPIVLYDQNGQTLFAWGYREYFSAIFHIYRKFVLAFCVFEGEYTLLIKLRLVFPMTFKHATIELEGPLMKFHFWCLFYKIL